uniref:Uncharacterized protein n=1 Tax=Arundo donax TaxID=35708 RepID=A0A0A9D1C1_ARUDO
MPNKTRWPKANYGFFLHPLLLRATAGRRRNERYKSCTDKKKQKGGQRKCPICTGYGHHWYNCKKGNPKDIEAMMAVRGPPKKKRRPTKEASQSSVVPFEDETLASSMSFSPSQSVKTATKTKSSKSGTSSSGGSARLRRGSNQLETFTIEYLFSSEQITTGLATTSKAKGPVKVKAKTKIKNLTKDLVVVSLDSLAMGT